MLGYYSQEGVSLLLLAISLATFALKVWALVDCGLRRPQLFVAAGKQTKTVWLVILGVAVLIHLAIAIPINLLNVIGVIAAIVYLVDVRPALQQIGGGGGGFGRRRDRGGW